MRNDCEDMVRLPASVRLVTEKYVLKGKDFPLGEKSLIFRAGVRHSAGGSAA